MPRRTCSRASSPFPGKVARQWLPGLPAHPARGRGVGVAFALIPAIAGLPAVSFGSAMVLKFLVVLLSVYVACLFGVGWTGRKFNHAVAHKAALA